MIVNWMLHNREFEKEDKAMAGTKVTQQKIGRDARTGQFIPVKEAERKRSTAIVESIKHKKTR